MIENKQIIVSVGDIYPYGYEIPKGFTGNLTLLTDGCMYLMQNPHGVSTQYRFATHTDCGLGTVRIILTKSKRRVVRFVYQGHRQVKMGDYYNPSGRQDFIEWVCTITSDNLYDCWTREEIEEEIP